MAIPMPCPKCRKPVRSDDPRCPHCGMVEPGKSWMRVIPGLLMLNPESVVRDIIYVNVAIYLFALVFMPVSAGSWRSPFSVLAPSEASLLLFGATGAVPIGSMHRWWTLLSANYLHAGIVHILFNMWALGQIGPMAVLEYGPARLVLLYTLGGATGFLVSCLAGVPITVGASAAVCSLIGAHLFHYARKKGSNGLSALGAVVAWVVVIVLVGFLVPSVNNWAHAGGIAAGFLLGALLGRQEESPEKPIHRQFAVGCCLATFFVLSWGLGNVLYLRLLAGPGVGPP